MSAELLTPRELMDRLGYRKSRFYALQSDGRFRFLETTRPIGTRRYAKAKVDRYLAGESTALMRSA